MADIAQLLIEHDLCTPISFETVKSIDSLKVGNVVRSTKHDKRLHQGVGNGFANKSINPSQTIDSIYKNVLKVVSGSELPRSIVMRDV